MIRSHFGSRKWGALQLTILGFVLFLERVAVAMRKDDTSGLHRVEKAILGEVPTGDGEGSLKRLGLLLQFEEEDGFEDLYREAREFITLEAMGITSLRATAAGTLAVSGPPAPLDAWSGGLPAVDLPSGAGVLVTTPEDPLLEGGLDLPAFTVKESAEGAPNWPVAVFRAPFVDAARRDELLGGVPKDLSTVKSTTVWVCALTGKSRVARAPRVPPVFQVVGSCCFEQGPSVERLVEPSQIFVRVEAPVLQGRLADRVFLREEARRTLLKLPVAVTSMARYASWLLEQDVRKGSAMEPIEIHDACGRPFPLVDELRPRWEPFMADLDSEDLQVGGPVRFSSLESWLGSRPENVVTFDVTFFRVDTSVEAADAPRYSMKKTDEVLASSPEFAQWAGLRLAEIYRNRESGSAKAQWSTLLISGKLTVKVHKPQQQRRNGTLTRGPPVGFFAVQFRRAIPQLPPTPQGQELYALHPMVRSDGKALGAARLSTKRHDLKIDEMALAGLATSLRETGWNDCVRCKGR